MNKSTILPQLRRLIERSGLTTTEIALRAKVDYQALRRFSLGVTSTYNAASAECVYFALTGKTFVRAEDALVVRAKRKRKAA